MTPLIEEELEKFDEEFPNNKGRNSDGYELEKHINTGENRWDSYDARGEIKQFLHDSYLRLLKKAKEETMVEEKDMTMMQVNNGFALRSKINARWNKILKSVDNA